MVIVEAVKKHIKQVSTLSYKGFKTSSTAPALETVLIGPKISEKTSTFMKEGKIYRQEGPPFVEEVLQ